MWLALPLKAKFHGTRKINRKGRAKYFLVGSESYKMKRIRKK
jgi:hypothetical protein